MKVIVDINKKTIKMLENNRAVFKGEYGADKLQLYINKELENEYPVITGLLSNGRRIGAFTTDDAYEFETIDGVEYTRADFTLSKENGFSLSEGLTQITIWIYRTKDTTIISKEAIGNVVFTVVNTTAFNDGDIIIAGDVEGTVVNLKVEMENLQAKAEQYLPLTGGKPMTGNLKMQGNNIIFDNGNEEIIEIGEENDEYSMSIRMEDSDYYKGRYRASGFSIGNESINATLNISESRFEMALKGEKSSSITPDGFSANKEGITTYGDGKVTRYLDDHSKYVEIEIPKKSGELALTEDIPTKTSQLENDSNYASQDDLNNVIEIAEGKTKTYVIEARLNSFLGTTSQEALSFANTLELTTVDGIKIPFIDLNKGDVILLTDTDLPDRFVGSVGEQVVFYPLESRKMNLDDYAKKTEIPTKISQLEQDIPIGGAGVSEKVVMDIIENNAEQTDTLDVGTSTTFDATSDEQIPTSKAVSDLMASAGGGSKLYRHIISFNVTYNNSSIPCNCIIENYEENAYDTTTLLNYLSEQSLPVISGHAYSENQIYTCTHISNSSGSLRGTIRGMKFTLNDDNSISISGIKSMGSIVQFEDKVTEL